MGSAAFDIIPERNIGFSVVARCDVGVQAVVFKAAGMPELWKPALCARSADKNKTGKARGKARGKRVASVADLTKFVDTSKWPPDTHLIVR